MSASPMKREYKIEALSGQYIHEWMRSAPTREIAKDTLFEAMGYLGYPDAVIEHIDGGDLYAYANRDAADAEEHPILVATEIQS